MPTEKPRVTITMTEEALNRINEFRFKFKYKNQTQAILSLIEKGFEAYQDFHGHQTPTPKSSNRSKNRNCDLSDEEIRVGRAFSKAPDKIKKGIRNLLDLEKPCTTDVKPEVTGDCAQGEQKNVG
jgi:hypothetical protein